MSDCCTVGKASLAALLVVLFSACGSEEAIQEPQHVAIYAAADPDFARLIEESPGQIELDEIERAPLLSFEEMTAYRPDIHTLYLTPAGAAKVRSLQVGVDGVPFLVYVGSEQVFTGYFMTVVSSVSRDAVICLDRIGPDAAGEKIQFQLGYPTPQFFTGEDPRNDSRLLAAFRRAGKLR